MISRKRPFTTLFDSHCFEKQISLNYWGMYIYYIDFYKDTSQLERAHPNNLTLTLTYCLTLKPHFNLLPL